MYAKSRSMDYPSFFHPSISAAKDRAPDLLGLEEEEEDNLYAELWQQILQLTLDEDGNPVGLTNQGSCPVVVPSPVSCSDSRMNRNVKPSPVWQLSLPRRGSGTGVFIPTITKKGVCQGIKASKKKKKKKKAKKQVENK